MSRNDDTTSPHGVHTIIQHATLALARYTEQTTSRKALVASTANSVITQILDYKDGSGRMATEADLTAAITQARHLLDALVIAKGRCRWEGGELAVVPPGAKWENWKTLDPVSVPTHTSKRKP